MTTCNVKKLTCNVKPTGSAVHFTEYFSILQLFIKGYNFTV